MAITTRLPCLVVPRASSAQGARSASRSGRGVWGFGDVALRFPASSDAKTPGPGHCQSFHSQTAKWAECRLHSPEPRQENVHARVALEMTTTAPWLCGL